MEVIFIPGLRTDRGGWACAVATCAILEWGRETTRRRETAPKTDLKNYLLVRDWICDWIFTRRMLLVTDSLQCFAFCFFVRLFSRLSKRWVGLCRVQAPLLLESWRFSNLTWLTGVACRAHDTQHSPPFATTSGFPKATDLVVGFLPMRCLTFPVFVRTTSERKLGSSLSAEPHCVNGSSTAERCGSSAPHSLLATTRRVKQRLGD